MSDKIIEFPRTKSNCGEPASQTAYSANEKHSELGSLEVLKHRILTGDKI